MSVGKEQGRVRQQKVDLTIFLLCGLGDSCTQELLATVAFTRPQQGL